MKKIVIIAGIICCALLAQGCSSCSRQMKSLRSDFSGGLIRRAVLMDYTGDTIKVWEGKFDIRDSGSDNQIFFDFNDKRVWIQGGIFVSEEL